MFTYDMTLAVILMVVVVVIGLTMIKAVCLWGDNEKILL